MCPHPDRRCGDSGIDVEMTYAKSTDNNHAIIRDGLRTCGYYVRDTSGVGRDFPDLLAVSKAGVTVLLEIKNREGKNHYPSWGQFKFLYSFPGPASIVFDIDDALKVMAKYD